jgi:hypothetical protein
MHKPPFLSAVAGKIIAPHFEQGIFSLIFWPTLQVSHGYGRRDGCHAAGVTDIDVAL